MQIEDTELEYNEADGVVLDYFLGEHHETKEQWAKRIVALCSEYKETNGQGRDGKGMPAVYARTPESLWEEKKGRRRGAFMFEMSEKHLNDNEAEFLANAEKKCSCGEVLEWSNSHSDSAVVALLNDSRYKTATTRHREELQKMNDLKSEALLERQKKWDSLLATGLSSDAVNIILGARP
ncbi:MAG: hypothetical protein KAR20_16620 [Candidatus Heimdallarchaeota archaeon]|nr:hypothetical protein [Candidatus Heimdallarchaeota archaeon]